MQVAIVHDWLVTDAGAEKVLKELVDLYPDADIFSLVDFLSSKQRDTILKGKKASTSFIQKLPFAKSHFRNYLPLFPIAIESFQLQKYDLVISSSWAVAKGVKTERSQTHICYCYTPIRYAWDLYDEYTANLWQPKKMVVQKTLKYIREWDLKTLDRVDYFIACSHYVAKRIEKTYAIKDVEVIYPPVDTQHFTFHKKKEEFYLSASRLVPYKKTKLIVQAFNQMPDKKLVVIGDGEEYNEIKKIAKENVIVLGYQEREVLIDFMQHAKGFVYAAIEDFGIAPIEALSCGTPVIALNEGGTKETINSTNGVLFETQTIESIIDAVAKFEKKRFDSLKISQNVEFYNPQRFKDEIKQFIKKRFVSKEYNAS